MVAARPTLKIAFWPKFSSDKDVCVFTEAAE
jgi:hypothetical protein